VKPVLERSGLAVGRDIFLAHCPERVMPGRMVLELVHNARVIGGHDATSAQLARRLYARFVEGVIHLTDATSAEMAKLVENTYRDVNVALANELALIADRIGVDIWHAIELANLHPRVNVLRPGPGVGGHCIPVDPWFLVQVARDAAHLLVAARAVNDAMPAHVADTALDLLAGLPPRAAVLGVTYRGGVADTRSSPALAVIEHLLRRGVTVTATDPLARSFPHPLLPLDEAVRDASLLLFLADHACYTAIVPTELAPVTPARRVLDTRCCLDHPAWRAAGFHVAVLGQPGPEPSAPPRISP